MKKLIILIILAISTFTFGQDEISWPGQKRNVAQILSCSIGSDTVVYWTAKEDTVRFVYLIQQFRWNRWVTWDSVHSTNSRDSTKYAFKVSRYLHSGENKFRIKSVNLTPKSLISNSIFFKNDEFVVLKSSRDLLNHQKKIIMFERKTDYELYDEKGFKLKSGYDDSINIIGLEKGIYYLNYDNKSLKLNYAKDRLEITKKYF